MLRQVSAGAPPLAVGSLIVGWTKRSAVHRYPLRQGPSRAYGKRSGDLTPIVVL